MPCYHPISAIQITPGSKPILLGKKNLLKTKANLELPCGQCIGCRLERSRQWAIRCIHEASLYEENCFITLTYDNDNLPFNGTLLVKDYQLFMKRLRKYFQPKKIRFFQCGEYGEKLNRPHYHACLFGHDFPDKKPIKSTSPLYYSPILATLWPAGYHVIGEVTFESAAYVARYITKKITGTEADEHYDGRKPEYITMSRRPGIGKDWFDKYYQDLYNNDQAVIKENLIVKPPKYYDKQYDLLNPSDLERIKNIRKANAPDFASDRLKVKEKLQIYKFKQLKRGYENER